MEREQELTEKNFSFSELDVLHDTIEESNWDVQKRCKEELSSALARKLV